MPSLDVLLEVLSKLSTIVRVILCLTCILSLIKWKKLTPPLKYLALYLIWNLVIEFSAFLYMRIYSISNLPFLHLYTIGEFAFLSLFYNSLLSTEIDKKTLNIIPPKLNRLLIFMLIGIVLIILNSIYLEKLTTYNSNSKTFVQVIIIAYAVLYFYNLSSMVDLSSTTEKSLRLINSALMIYYSGSLFIFMFGNYYQSNQEVYMMFWVFNAVLNLIFQLVVLYAIWKIAFKETKLSI